MHFCLLWTIEKMFLPNKVSPWKKKHLKSVFQYIYLFCFLVGWKTFEAKFFFKALVKSANTHGMFTFPFKISTTVYLSNTRLLQVHKKGGGLLQILQKKCTTLDVWWSHFSEVIFSPQLNIGPIIHMYIYNSLCDYIH